MGKLLIAGAAALALTACDPEPADTRPSGPAATVVVTYSVLGSIVSDLVGDRAVVEVIIANGQDPHDVEPSARDIETINNADVVVSNGLDLEEPMIEAIEAAQAAGVPVFYATDHLTVRELADDDEHSGGEQTEGDAHDHGGGDPHIWVDPLTLGEMVPALGATLGSALGIDLGTEVQRVQANLADADARVGEILSVLPPDGCKLVTGHNSLGYFADRYGCEVIGAIVPSLTSTAETSAKELAELRQTATSAGVAAVFTEPGTSADVAEQIADEIGVSLVELPTIELPEDGSYTAFITLLAQTIVDGLQPA
jgi:zinc/manganese transport system substrate-binding protein